MRWCKLPVPGRPTIWITVGRGLTALAVGAGGGCLDIFALIYPFSPLSPSLWETSRYRLKYCLKGPLNPKQPTNRPTHLKLKNPSVSKFFPLGFPPFSTSGLGNPCYWESPFCSIHDMFVEMYRCKILTTVSSLYTTVICSL